MSSFFSMSADNSDASVSLKIPVVFLFHLEGQKILNQHIQHPKMVVQLSEKVSNPRNNFILYNLNNP